MTSFILLADGPVSPLDTLRRIIYMSCYNRYSASSDMGCMRIRVWVGLNIPLVMFISLTRDVHYSMNNLWFDKHSTSATICLHYAMYSLVPWLMYSFIIHMLLLKALYLGVSFLLFGVVIFCQELSFWIRYHHALKHTTCRNSKRRNRRRQLLTW